MDIYYYLLIYYSVKLLFFVELFFSFLIFWFKVKIDMISLSHYIK